MGQPQIPIEKVHQIIGRVVMDAALREEQLLAILQQQDAKIKDLIKTEETAE